MLHIFLIKEYILLFYQRYLAWDIFSGDLPAQTALAVIGNIAFTSGRNKGNTRPRQSVPNSLSNIWKSMILPEIILKNQEKNKNKE